MGGCLATMPDFSVTLRSVVQADEGRGSTVSCGEYSGESVIRTCRVSGETDSWPNGADPKAVAFGNAETIARSADCRMPRLLRKSSSAAIT